MQPEQSAPAPTLREKIVVALRRDRPGDAEALTSRDILIALECDLEIMATLHGKRLMTPEEREGKGSAAMAIAVGEPALSRVELFLLRVQAAELGEDPDAIVLPMPAGGLRRIKRLLRGFGTGLSVLWGEEGEVTPYDPDFNKAAELYLRVSAWIKNF